MDLDRLQYFSTLEQTGHLRRAAEILSISPPALSKSMHSLQDEIGVDLFFVSGRNIRITQQGESFAREARKILLQVENLKEKINQKKRIEEQAPIRIATFEVFSTHFLSILNHPTLGLEKQSLDIHEVLPGELERMVANHEADYGISYLPIAYPGCEHTKITQIEMGVFTKAQSFKGVAQPDLPFVIPIMPPKGAPSRVKGLDGWPEFAYERKVKYQVTLLETALELCRLGKAAGYFPCFLIEQHNKKLKASHHLERRLSPYGPKKCYTDVYLVSPKGIKEDKKTRQIAKMIRMGCQKKSYNY